MSIITSLSKWLVFKRVHKMVKCDYWLCYVWPSLFPHKTNGTPGRIFMEFDIWIFFENPSRKTLCLWFRASLIYINNCPTRCNTKQSIYYSASSLYLFRVSTAPIIRSAQNFNYSLQYRSYFFVQLSPSNVVNLLSALVAAQKIWPVSEAVVTVLCTPDDGCGWHPKHVEWTCRIINRLLCVAPRWTSINIYMEKMYH